MIRRLSLLFCALAAVLPAQDPIEILATVTAVDGRDVYIRVSNPGFLPKPGDRVGFLTRVPGLGWTTVRGDWRVAEVNRDARGAILKTGAAETAVPRVRDRAIVYSTDSDPLRSHAGQPALVNLLENSRCAGARDLVRQGVNAATATAALSPAYFYCRDVIPSLLAAGANPDAGVDERRSILYSVVAAGDTDMARVLLKAGANPNAKVGGTGQTGLIRAVESKDIDMIRLLLEFKADVDIGDDKSLTARQYAQDTRDPEIIRLLENARSR